MLNIPIPQIYVSQNEEGVWDVIDGVQRLSTIFQFMGILKDDEGKKIEPFVNNFIDKKTSIDLFDKLFSRLGNFKYWYLSYNNSSYPTKEILVELLGKYSDNIKIIERPHIYKITGKENKKSNIEYLFIVENKN